MRDEQAGVENVRSTLRSGRFLFAVSFFLLFAASTLARSFGKYHNVQDGDFYVYFFAGEAVHHHPHADLYFGASEHNPQLRIAPPDSELSRVARLAGHSAVEFYLYPPLLADLLAPFASLAPTLAAHIWRVLNLILVLLSAVVIARLLGLSVLTAEFAVLTLAAYSFFPVTETLFTGQITLLLLLLWTVGVAAYAEQRIILSAVVFALATVLKVNPLVLLPLFLLWREWRWLASYLISVGVLVLSMIFINGWQNLLSYAHVVSAMGGGVPTSSNRCISSLVGWLYYGHFLPDVDATGWLPSPTPLLSALTKIATLTFYVVILAVLWRRWAKPTPHEKIELVSLFALLACVLSPVTWRHGYAIALLPLGIFWAQALRNRIDGLRTFLLMLVTVTTGTIFIDVAIQVHLPALVKISLTSTWALSSMSLILNVLLSERSGPKSNGHGPPRTNLIPPERCGA